MLNLLVHRVTRLHKITHSRAVVLSDSEEALCFMKCVKVGSGNEAAARLDAQPGKEKDKKVTTSLVSKHSSLKINAIFCRLIVQRVKITASAFTYVNSCNVTITITSVIDILRLNSLYRSLFRPKPAANFVAAMAFLLTLLKEHK
jgi:hypothetical protein